jgi:hypothetical protein
MVAAAVGFGGDDEVGLGKLLDRGMEEMMRALAVLAEKAASGAGKQWSREGKKKMKGKSWTRGEGTVGAVVGSLSLCFPSSPLSFSLPFFVCLSPPLIGKESLAVIMVSGTSHKTCPIISAIYCKPYPCFNAENGYLLRRQ